MLIIKSAIQNSNRERPINFESILSKMALGNNQTARDRLIRAIWCLRTEGFPVVYNKNVFFLASSSNEFYDEISVREKRLKDSLFKYKLLKSISERLRAVT